MPADPVPRGFVHHACLYGSDDDFLATALPFVADGLRAGEPVLAATTPAHIELLQGELGARAALLDIAETARFGRRPVERVAAFLKYADRRGGPGRRTRMIAEPLWAGRTARQIAEWKRMEAGLNVLLADAELWMICPYDTRTVPGHVAASALATHPAQVTGERVTRCPRYADPERYAAALDDGLSVPPEHADRLPGPAAPAAVRKFVRYGARAAGLRGSRLALAEMAAGEACTLLLARGADGAEVRAWEEPGVLVWDLHGTGPAAELPGRFAGFGPPGRESADTDGLWLLRHLCESVEVRCGGGRLRLRLRYAGSRDVVGW
jgi:hypothetical protein